MQTAVVDPQLQRRRFPCVIIRCDRRFTSQYTLKVHCMDSEAHKPKPTGMKLYRFRAVTLVLLHKVAIENFAIPL
ncbi:hypothetical protein BDZ97DRAFT_1884760 [Flammula alnicola]|nr:hypothetical protein BDZ97DRAFT_1884760 [Flammula alnicola]